jgi:hypothetical protein
MAFMKKMKDSFNKLVGTPMDPQVINSCDNYSQLLCPA